MRVVIEIKRGEEPKLISQSSLQAHADAGIVRHDPAVGLSAGSARIGPGAPAELFIDQRVEVVRRRTLFELRQGRSA